MGLRLKFSQNKFNIKLFVSLLIVAITGKIGGVLLSNPFVNIDINKLYLISYGMNSRGAIEIAIAMIALRNNILPIEVYNSLILIVLITSIMFIFTIKTLTKNKADNDNLIKNII